MREDGEKMNWVMYVKWKNNEQKCQKARMSKKMSDVFNFDDEDGDGLHVQEMFVQVAP
jgi:hypothetical protein